MPADCVFCDIIHHRLQAGVVYDDDDTLAFVDPRQTNRGHLLVIPKIHVERIYQLPDPCAPALMRTLVLMSKLVQRHIAPDGLSIWQSNDRGAHQEVPHVHFHVFPRYQDDQHLRIYPAAPGKIPLAQRLQLAAEMRQALAATGR